MNIRAAALVALASLLIGACGPIAATPSPSSSPSAPSSPVASASPTASAAPSNTSAFSISPPIQHLDPTTILANSDRGLVRSDDAGKTWSVVGAPPFARFVELRMIDRERGWNVLFFNRDQPQIGCQQASTAAPCRSPAAVTSDGGRTWTVRLSNPLNAGGGESIDHLQAVDATHAWALVTTACDSTACDKDLRVTADSGVTWRTLRSGRLTQLRVASLAQAWLGADAGNGSLVYATADSGATWRQQLATEQPLVALDAASERDAWALTRDGAYCTSSSCQRYELLVTRDGGTSWSSLANPKDNTPTGTAEGCTFGNLTGPVFASPQIGWLGASRGTGGAAGTGGIMRTQNGGRTWTCFVVPPDVERVSAADPDHVLALSRDAQTAGYAVWLSTDSGFGWTPIVPR